MHLCACAEHAFGSMHDDETYLKMMQWTCQDGEEVQQCLNDASICGILYTVCRDSGVCFCLALRLEPCMEMNAILYKNACPFF